MFWLINHEVGLELQRAQAAGFSATEAQLSVLTERHMAALGGTPRNLRIAGDVAEIRVEGVLTEKPSFLAFLLGGGTCTYEQIRQAFGIAQADDQIKRVELFVSSPGGQLDGLFDTLGAIQAFAKPIMVRASKAESAAYALAAVAGKIEATNAACQFGSIGVVKTFIVDEHEVDVTSTGAPKKRPDPTTPEGQAVIREHLDAIHDVFVEAIARGRGTTIKDVTQNFGRGATLLAGEAKRRGMIDKIARPALRAVVPGEFEAHSTGSESAASEPVESPPVAPTAGAQPRKTVMNKIELQQQHPEVYAAVLAEGHASGRTEGLAAGTEAERDRVTAHLIRGHAAGAMPLAIEAIEKGTPMTEALRAKYDTAAKNRDDTATRQTESDAAGAATEGAAAPEQPKTLIDLFAQDLPPVPASARAS